MKIKHAGAGLGFKTTAPIEKVEKRLRKFHKTCHLMLDDQYIEHDIYSHALLRKNKTSVLGELRGAIDGFIGTYIQQKKRVPSHVSLQFFVDQVEVERGRVATELKVDKSQVRTVPVSAIEHWVETSMERGRQILQTGKPIPKDLKKLLNYRIPVHL